jgi:putative solute:sodium symporter small subunit
VKEQNYWKKNIQYVMVLLLIWFAVSYGAGILFKDSLDQIYLGGFPLGFWFAQQGSIYVFVVLIFVYVRLMNKLDKQFGYDTDGEENA